ncbi:DUF5453 family protein [[Mycoplasma] testudinis]|uniref:DUF5453 family protein n=1 Tax=[Mycoplasma] testudinis TaxID=33924 RepID=UPI000487B7BE|nr:DUF5453 family protein [[Mycoplasma] testudinis]
MKRNWRTHYNVLVANLLLVIATGINFAVWDLLSRGVSLYAIFAAPFIGIILSIFLYYLDLKYFLADYPYKKFHFNKKYTKFYITGFAIFAVEIIVLIVLTIAGVLNVSTVSEQLNTQQGPALVANALVVLRDLMWASFACACIIGVTGLGFVKYARLKIDVELLLREKRLKEEVENVASVNKIMKKIDSDDKPVIVDLGEDKSSRSSRTDEDTTNNKKDPPIPSAGLSSI